MKHVQGRPLDIVVRDVRSAAHRDDAGHPRAVGDALSYAHRHGVIHREHQVRNIMLDEEGGPSSPISGSRRSCRRRAHHDRWVVADTYAAPVISKTMWSGFWGISCVHHDRSDVGTCRYGDYVSIRQAPATEANPGNLFTAFGYGLNSFHRLVRHADRYSIRSLWPAASFCIPIK